MLPSARVSSSVPQTEESLLPVTSMKGRGVAGGQNKITPTASGPWAGMAHRTPFLRSPAPTPTGASAVVPGTTFLVVADVDEHWSAVGRSVGQQDRRGARTRRQHGDPTGNPSADGGETRQAVLCSYQSRQAE
jgi:hypothetical protein